LKIKKEIFKSSANKIKMANKTNSTGNFFETLVDAQQQAFDTMVENTKKFSNGNAIVNDSIEKGSEFFKKTVDATKESMDQVNAQTSNAQAQAKTGAEKATEYFTNWKNQQVQWANQLQEMNTNLLKNSWNTNNMQNPMSNWQSMMNNAGSQFDMSKMMNMGNMSNMMNMMNPSSMQSQMDNGMEQVKAFWNQFQTIMNTNYTDLTKNFQNGTLADTYKGMFNTSEGFSKFYEMWMPMMKSMQDKTFNMDMFSKNLNMGQYKEFMDKYFSFMPQSSQDYISKMKDMYGEAIKNSTSQSKEMMNSWKESMSSFMPQMAGNPYTNLLNNYNSAYGQMMNAVSPFAKLMTPSNDTKSMQEWVSIMNNTTIYNIKNAELQQMVYETGMKVMEKIAATTMHKIENGEEVNSMMKLYQEYLNTSDRMYVDLFETDEYSKLMAEVSSMKMSIKKSVETQMEKALVNVPVATRSEMDEVYQAMYDLKKLVRTLETKLNEQTQAAAQVKETPHVAHHTPVAPKPESAKPAPFAATVKPASGKRK